MARRTDNGSRRRGKRLVILGAQTQLGLGSDTKGRSSCCKTPRAPGFQGFIPWQEYARYGPTVTSEICWALCPGPKLRRDQLLRDTTRPTLLGAIPTALICTFYLCASRGVVRRSGVMTDGTTLGPRPCMSQERSPATACQMCSERPGPIRTDCLFMQHVACSSLGPPRVPRPRGRCNVDQGRGMTSSLGGVATALLRVPLLRVGILTPNEECPKRRVI